jgi:hypothetical protein
MGISFVMSSMVNQCEAKLLANEMFRRPRWNSRNASQEQFLSWNASFAGRLLGETVEILTMSFNPVSYFAGIGTVFVAIAVGFGGGLLMTNSVHNPDPPNRVERVASSAPLVSPTTPTPPNTAQASTTPVVAPAPAPNPSASATSVATATPQVGPPSSPPQASTSSQRAVPQQPPSAEVARANDQQPARTQQPAVPNDQPAVVRESNAKPQDQDADARKIAEKKQADRRKWAERKRKQQELEAATVEVRKTERGEGPQEVIQRDIVEMPRIEMPRLGFFGDN